MTCRSLRASYTSKSLKVAERLLEYIVQSLDAIEEFWFFILRMIYELSSRHLLLIRSLVAMHHRNRRRPMFACWPAIVPITERKPNGYSLGNHGSGRIRYAPPGGNLGVNPLSRDVGGFLRLHTLGSHQYPCSEDFQQRLSDKLRQLRVNAIELGGCYFRHFILTIETK